MDLSEELEAAIGDGPALPDPAERLAAGRAGLRRHRVLVGAGTALAAAAVVVPVVLVAGGGEGRALDPAPLAPAPTSQAPSPAPSGPTAVDARPSRSPGQPWPKGEYPARVDLTDGSQPLRIRDGALVHDRRDDVYAGKDTESVALDLSFRGQRYWIVLEWDEGGSAGSYGGPGDDVAASFDEFVARQVAGGGLTSGRPRGTRADGDAGFPDPGNVEGLTWTGDGFAASGATEILEQRSGIDLGPSFAAADDTTGAAYVRMAGARQLVVYRELEGGRGDLIAVHSAGRGDSLDELLAWARQRYRSGSGLL